MPEILKDRNYYRMLSDEQLREEAERTQNELALTVLGRKDENPRYASRWGKGWQF